MPKMDGPVPTRAIPAKAAAAAPPMIFRIRASLPVSRGGGSRAMPGFPLFLPLVEPFAFFGGGCAVSEETVVWIDFSEAPVSSWLLISRSPMAS